MGQSAQALSCTLPPIPEAPGGESLNGPQNAGVWQLFSEKEVGSRSQGSILKELTMGPSPLIA